MNHFKSPTTSQATARRLPITPQQNEIAMLNSKFINLFSGIVRRNPSMRLTEFLRIHVDKYVRGLRKIYPEEAIEDVGASENSGYLTVHKLLSFSETMNMGPDRVEVDNLVNLINGRCIQNTDPRSQTSQYHHVPTR